MFDQNQSKVIFQSSSQEIWLWSADILYTINRDNASRFRIATCNMAAKSMYDLALKAALYFYWVTVESLIGRDLDQPCPIEELHPGIHLR